MYLADGFDDYLSKPIDSNELEAVIRKHLPQEKVVVEILESQVDAFTEQNGAPAECYIDMDTGMMYSAGSEEIFREFLGMFCSLYEKKLSQIEACYTAEDWNGYGIELHSLKSTSLSIGGKRISELAFELEKAGKAGDGAYIREHHEAAKALYAATVQEGRKILENIK